jgi:hypothetical protein
VTAQRDPVSVLFDRGARDLLARAYAAPRGTWVGTRVADPGPQTRLQLAMLGIDWKGPDNPSVPGGRGGLNARDRWTRGFVRALYYHHRQYSAGAGLLAERRLTPNLADALEVDVGRRVIPRGIIPAGRAVRVRVRQGGRNARQAVIRKPDRDRIYDDYGDLAGRASYLELRDW